MHPNTWALEGHLATRALAGNFVGIQALRNLKDNWTLRAIKHLSTQGIQPATWAVRHFGTQGNLLRGIIYEMSIKVFGEL